MNKNEDDPKIVVINNKRNIIIPDIYLEEFLNSITENRIKTLYLKLKLYESKGYITDEKYLQCMKETFDEPIKIQIKKKFDDMRYDMNQNIDSDINIVTYMNEIYELYFLRFREIKCIMKNNKTVFYLTDFKLENYISTYNVICSIIIFFKSTFENKIKILFNLTDVDEDGFLNEIEIKQMIATCNFLFCEEGNIINTNSSILAQSLMNIKVNNILKEILYDPGNLYIYLEEEKYINFDLLFRSIKLVKDYKYRIIPCYVNLKQCLNNVKKEKIIAINDKYKYDFITVSSSLFANKSMGSHRSLRYNKNFSIPCLSTIIKPKKITKNNEINNQLELPKINQSVFNKRNNLARFTKKSSLNALYKNKIIENNINNITNLNKIIFSKESEMNQQANKNKLIIEKKKNFRELLRESTIIEMVEKNKNNETNKNFNKSSYYNEDSREIKYVFEANFDKIRNIEVEPGLIKFINGNIENNLSNNSNTSGSHNILKKNNINNFENNESRKKNVNLNIIKEKEKGKRNFISKEERSIERQEDKSKTSNNSRKKMKTIKIINLSKNKTEKNKNQLNMNSKKNYSKTINVGYNTKNEPKNKNNMNKIINFNRSPNNRETSLRTKLNFGNIKGEVNLQKSLMNLTINEGQRYKTLDEVFHEIRIQENKFNSDSYGGYVASLLNGLKKINEERKDIKKLLGESEKKDISLNFHKNYLNKISKRKKPVVVRSKSVD